MGDTNVSETELEDLDNDPNPTEKELIELGLSLDQFEGMGMCIVTPIEAPEAFKWTITCYGCAEEFELEDSPSDVLCRKCSE